MSSAKRSTNLYLITYQQHPCLRPNEGRLRPWQLGAQIDGRVVFIWERHSVPAGRASVPPNQSSAEVRTAFRGLKWCGSEPIGPLSSCLKLLGLAFRWRPVGSEALELLLQGPHSLFRCGSSWRGSGGVLRCCGGSRRHGALGRARRRCLRRILHPRSEVARGRGARRQPSWLALDGDCRESGTFIRGFDSHPRLHLLTY